MHQAGVVPPRKLFTASISGHLQVGHHQIVGHHQMKYIGLDLQESPERAKVARVVDTTEENQARAVDFILQARVRVANRVLFIGED